MLAIGVVSAIRSLDWDPRRLLAFSKYEVLWKLATKLELEPDLMSDDEFKVWIEKYRNEADRIAQRIFFPEAADAAERSDTERRP